MATTAADLQVKFSTMGEAKTAAAAANVGNEVEKTASKAKLAAKDFYEFQRSVNESGQRLTQSISQPVLAFAKSSTQAASNVEETLSKVNVVFGDSAGIINEWGATSVKSMGMSDQAAQASAATLGNLFTGMGQTQEGAANMSMGVVQLAADLGSFNNVPTADALAAIQAGLIGEFEPLRKYGVLITSATVEQKAMEMGIWDGVGALSEEQKVLARHALILEQTTSAQGDFARTSDGMANSSKIAAAELENAKAALGAVLLPIVTKGTQLLAKFIMTIMKMPPALKNVVVVVALVAAAIGPLLIGLSLLSGAFGFIIGGIALAGGAFAALTGAIGGIGGAVAGSVAVIAAPLLLIIGTLGLLYLAYKTNFLGFADGIKAVGGWLVDTFHAIVDSIGLFVRIIEVATGPSDVFGGQAVRLQGLMSQLPGPIQAVIGAITGLVTWFQNAVDTVNQLIDSFESSITSGFNPLQAAILALSSVFPSLSSGLLDLYTGLMRNWTVIKMFLDGDIAGGFKAIGDAFVNAFGMIDWAGIGSSIMDGLRAIGSMVQDAFGFIDWAGVGGKIMDGLRTALTFLGDLATDIGTWLREQAEAVDWKGILSTAAGVAGDITSSIVTGLGNLTDSIGTWLAEKAGAVDWGGIIGTAAGLAGDITSTIVTNLGDLKTSITTWLADHAGRVTWGSTLTAAAGLVTDITATIVEKLGNLKDKIQAWITDAAAGISLDGIWSGITEQATTVITFFGDMYEAVKTWIRGAVDSETTADMWASITDQTDSIITNLGALGTKLKAWVTDGSAEIVWADIVTSMGEVGAIATAIATNIGDFAVAFDTWWTEQIAGVDWNAMGVTLGESAKSIGPGMLDGMIQGIIDNWELFIIGGLLLLFLGIPGLVAGYLLVTLGPAALELLKGFTDGLDLNWESVKLWLEGLGTKCYDAVKSQFETLKDRGKELGTGFKDGVENFWTDSLKPWIEALPGEIVTLLAGLPELLKTSGTAALTAYMSGCQHIWNNVLGPFIKRLPGEIVAFFDGLIELLKTSGTAAFNAYMNACQHIWNNVLGPFLKRLPGEIVAFFAGLPALMNTAGTAALNALEQGARHVWNNVAGPFIQGLPAQIVAFFAGLPALMLQAGKDAIQGLIDGVMGKIPGLETAVNTAVDLWNKLDLGNSPWPWMIKVGQDSIDGLIVGIGNRIAPLKKSISEVVGVMTSGITSTASNALKVMAEDGSMVANSFYTDVPAGFNVWKAYMAETGSALHKAGKDYENYIEFTARTTGVSVATQMAQVKTMLAGMDAAKNGVGNAMGGMANATQTATDMMGRSLRGVADEASRTMAAVDAAARSIRDGGVSPAYASSGDSIRMAAALPTSSSTLRSGSPSVSIGSVSVSLANTSDAGAISDAAARSIRESVYQELTREQSLRGT